jgi:hypothetical protein
LMQQHGAPLLNFLCYFQGYSSQSQLLAPQPDQTVLCLANELGEGILWKNVVPSILIQVITFRLFRICR